MLGTVERTAKADATPCLALLWVSATRSNPEGICRRRSTPATLPSSSCRLPKT